MLVFVCSVFVIPQGVKAQATDITTDFVDVAFQDAVRDLFGLTSGAPIMDDLDFASVTELDISGLGIEHLNGISYFTDLEKLNCSDNLLTAFDNFPAGGGFTATLKWIDCSKNQIVACDPLPGNLEYFDCSNNLLPGLPSLPNTLEYFNCSNNDLAALPALSGALTYLDCSFNSLPGLPSLPGTLTYLDCSNNDLAGLPALSGVLTYLDCSFNSLLGLDPFPGTLVYLDCRNNLLPGLPTFPGTLEHLNCSSNLLPGLPNLPGTLTYLDCSDNQLAALPTLTDLTFLNCNDNLLPGLPALPGTLEYLYCNNNLLTGLPWMVSLPLKEFTCSGNQLDALMTLPSTLYYLDCSNNLLSGSDLMIGHEMPAGTWNARPLPSGLEFLNCSDNFLTGLNVTGLNDLATLDCRLNYMADESDVIGLDKGITTVFDYNPQKTLLVLEENDFPAQVFCSESYVFGVTSKTNQYLGTMVKAKIELDNPASADLIMVEYFETAGANANTWMPLTFVSGVAYFGPPTGFPFASDITSMFRLSNNDIAVANTNISATVSIFDETDASETALVSVVLSTTVLSLPSVDVTDGAFPTMITCGKGYDFGVTTNAGCYDYTFTGMRVNAKIELSNPAVGDEITVEVFETPISYAGGSGTPDLTLSFTDGVALLNPSSFEFVTGNTTYFRLTNNGTTVPNMDFDVDITIFNVADDAVMATKTLSGATVMGKASLAVTDGVFPTIIAVGTDYDFGVTTNAGCYEYSLTGTRVNAKIELSNPAVGDEITVEVFQTPADYDNGNGTPNLTLSFDASGVALLNPSSFEFVTGNTTYFRVKNNGTAVSNMHFGVYITIFEVVGNEELADLTLSGAIVLRDPSLVSEDELYFTWEGGDAKCFNITASNGDDFTIEWGDDTEEEIFTGTGASQTIYYSYATGYYTVTVKDLAGCSFTALNLSYLQISALDLSAATSLKLLYCDNNKITTFVPPVNPLNFVQCFNNQLQLSDLYAISELVSNVQNKRLGTQTIEMPVTATVGEELFDGQNEFVAGTYTEYAVDGGTIDVDYEVTDGKITFLNPGTYTVTMTNAAIVSNPTYPAQVVVVVVVN